MPATRRVLKHLTIETAKARRECYRRAQGVSQLTW